MKKKVKKSKKSTATKRRHNANILNKIHKEAIKQLEEQINVLEEIDKKKEKIINKPLPGLLASNEKGKKYQEMENEMRNLELKKKSMLNDPKRKKAILKLIDIALPKTRYDLAALRDIRSDRLRDFSNQLKAYSFKNFKIFQNNNKFEIANCNALLGSNGVGKSTVFEVIKLFTQTRGMESINTLETYQGRYKNWNNSADVLFMKNTSKELMFEFETNVETRIFVEPSRREPNLSARDQNLARLSLNDNDIQQIIFKTLQKEHLDQSWNADQIIINGGLPALILEISENNKSNKGVKFSMRYKVQIGFEIPIRKQKKSINYLTISKLNIFDCETNVKISSFGTRKDQKKQRLNFSDSLKNLTTNLLSVKESEDLVDSFKNIISEDDFIQYSLMSENGHIRFWEILRMLMLDHQKVEGAITTITPARKRRMTLSTDGIPDKFFDYTPEQLRDSAHSVMPFFKVAMVQDGVFDFSSRIVPIAQQDEPPPDSYFKARDMIENTRALVSFVTDRIASSYGRPLIYAGYYDERYNERYRPVSFYRGIFRPINNFLYNSRFIESVQPEEVKSFQPNLSKKIIIDDEQDWKTTTVVDLLYRDEKVLKSLNKWLPKIGLHYKLKTESNLISAGGLPHIRVLAKDIILKTPTIDLQDIGYGAFQAIRLVVILLAYENKNIFLTEPEQNLHPSVHIKFVDLIYESITKNKNKIFIETHSENLVLKLLQMIKLKKFSPEAVNISVVTRDNEGGKLNRVKIDENGDAVSEWPEGFFADRYNLV